MALMTIQRPPIQRAPLARLPVVSAAVTLGVTLVVLTGRYGYHRDELYFAMLPPAWGYVDQPSFTPWLARSTLLIADQLWALRLPPMIFAVVSVLVIALITAELGGQRLAQGLAAWGYAFATMTLSFGHLLLTTSVDLISWPLITLWVIRAVARGQSRWWWLAGALIGASTYNKWLVIMLVVALLGGLLIAGPRRSLWSRPVLGAAGLAVLIAGPNLGWQVTHGLPQVRMGQALTAENAREVRILAVAFLPVMIGPLLFAFVVAGFVQLLRARAWRPVRFLAPALLIMVGLTALAGTQFYYSYGLLAVIFAAGCIPVASFAQRARWRMVVVLALLAVHVASNAVINLPLLPLPVLARTFVPALNPGVSDQVGWPTYVEQIDRAVDEARPADPGVVVVTSNYGEAGALRRFSRHPEVRVFSGHNALYDVGAPPGSATTVVIVGGQFASARNAFDRCAIVDELANGLDFDTEEEGEPVAICVGPKRPWPELWPTFRHLN